MINLSQSLSLMRKSSLRLVSAAAASVMLCAAVAPAGSALAAPSSFSLSASKTTVAPGETFTVSVRASSSEEYDRARSALEYYGKRFQLVGVEGASGAFPRAVYQGVQDPGGAYSYDCLAVERASETPLTGSKLLARITFRVAESAPAGTYTIGQAPESACTTALWRGDTVVGGSSPARLSVTVKAPAPSGVPAVSTPSNTAGGPVGRSGGESATRNLFGFRAPDDNYSDTRPYRPPTVDDLDSSGRATSLAGSVLGSIVLGGLVVGYLVNQGGAKKH